MAYLKATSGEIDRDSFLSGVMAALGVVYAGDDEVLAEEIIKEIGAPGGLERVAVAAGDPYLSNLRATIRFLRARGDIGKACT